MKKILNSHIKQNKNRVLSISKLLSVAVVMLLVITGCEKSRNSQDNITTLTIEAILNDSPTQENGDSQQTATRIDGTGFTAGDKIAFMAVKYNKADGGSNILGADVTTTYINEIYEHKLGQFRPFVGDKPDLYPSDGTNVDLYGVYYGPQTGAATEVVPFPFPYNAMPFTVKSVQTEANWYESDLMMAKAVNCKQQITPNRMLFHHLLAKMEIRVKLVGYEEGVNVEMVRVVKMATSAKFNIREFNNGTVPITLPVPGDITAREMTVEPSSGFDFKAQAIVIPQTIASGTEFVEITLSTTPNKDVYFLSIDEELQIEQGKNSVFNITITKGDLQHIKTTAIITDWVETSLESTTLSRRSEYRFKMDIINPKTSGYPFSSITSVKVGVNGNRTYTLSEVKYTEASDGVSASISFDFDGGANSPSGGHFIMNSVELISAYSSTKGAVVGDLTFNASTDVINELVYDETAGTIVKKI